MKNVEPKCITNKIGTFKTQKVKDSDEKMLEKWISKYYISLSIVIFLAMSFIKVVYIKEISLCKDIYLNMLTLVGENIAISLFISGTISIIMETPNFKKYFLNRLIEVVISDEYLRILSHDRKMLLKNRLEKEIFFMDKTDDPNSFFYVVQDKVTPLLDDYYFEGYHLHVDCYIEENYILKKIHRRMEIVTPNNKDLTIKIPLGASMQKIVGIDDKSLYKILLFKEGIDDKTEEINKKLYLGNIDDPDENYNVKVKVNHELKVSGKCIIEIKTQTMAPLTDINYSHRIVKPCRHYSLIFNLFNDFYKLSGNGFGFMTNNLGEETYVKNIYDKGIEIRFNDWIFPGDGAIFTIDKK